MSYPSYYYKLSYVALSILEKFLLTFWSIFFSAENRIDVSCNLFIEETISKKSETLFLYEKKNVDIINLLSADFGPIFKYRRWQISVILFISHRK